MVPHIHQNGGGYDVSQKRTIFSERELPRAFCFVDSTEMSGANTQQPVNPHNAHDNSHAQTRPQPFMPKRT